MYSSSDRTLLISNLSEYQSCDLGVPLLSLTPKLLIQTFNYISSFANDLYLSSRDFNLANHHL